MSHHRCGSRSLAHYYQWILTIITPSGYSAVSPSYVDPAVIVLLDQSLHTLQQITDGEDVRVGQAKVQNMGLSGSLAALSHSAWSYGSVDKNICCFFHRVWI